MKKFWPYLLGGVVLTGVIGAAVLLHGNRYKPRLIQYLSQRFDHPVLINQVRLGLFPPALTLEGFQILNRAEDARLAQAEKVQAHLTWGGLFKGQAVPHTLVIQGLVMSLNRLPDGGWACPEWIPASDRVAETFSWPIGTVAVRNGQCRLIDPYGAGPSEWLLQGLEGQWYRGQGSAVMKGQCLDLPSPINFSFQGQGRFLASPAWSGTLQLTDGLNPMELTCKREGDRLNVQGQSAAWRFDNAYAMTRFFTRWDTPLPRSREALTLQNWRGDFDLEGNHLSFSQAAELAEGKAEIKGTMVSSATIPLATVDCAFDGIHLQPVAQALWGSARWEGRAKGFLHMDVAISSDPWTSVHGHGSIEIAEGRYHWPESLAKGLARTRMMRYVKKKYADFLEQGMPFQKLSCHADVRAGVISFADGLGDLGAIQAGMVGKIKGKQGVIQAFMGLRIREKDPVLVREISPSYLYQAHGRLRVKPIYGVLQGTWEDLSLRACRAAAIPPTPLARLRKLLKS